MEATYDTPQTQLDTLYRLDIRTGQVGKLLDIEVKPERAGCSGFAIAMMLIVLGFLLSIIGFASGEEGLGIFGLLMGVVCVMISAIAKADNH